MILSEVPLIWLRLKCGDRACRKLHCILVLQMLKVKRKIEMPLIENKDYKGVYNDVILGVSRKINDELEER